MSKPLFARLKDDLEDIPITVEIEAKFSPYDSGVSSGPVERCYPPEGGEMENASAILTIGEGGSAFRLYFDWGAFSRLVGPHAAAKWEERLFEAAVPLEPDYDRLNDQARDDRLTGDA